MTYWILLLSFPAAMLLAAVQDLTSMTISNRLVIALAGSFFCLALLAGWPWSVVALHLAVGFGMLALCFACFAAGWMGGGDAKLIAATALWLGPSVELASFLIWTSIFGGALTLALLLARACLSPTTGLASVDRLLRPDTGIPYGVALGAAGLMVFPVLWAAAPT